MSRPLGWYLDRLQSMSVREVAARSGQSLMIGARRIGLFTAKRPIPPEIRDTLSWLHTAPSAKPELYVQAADRVLGGEEPVFALTDREVATDPRWNCDPLTGVVVPLQFGYSIDVHSQDVVGNIKYLWEPNRHLDLVVLAQAFNVTSDPKYAQGIRRRLDSWFEQCPYLMGPNWVSSLELGIRLINWSLTWQLIGAERSSIFDGADGKQFLDRWMRSVYQHVHFIRGHYSRFSSANNHLIGEAAGAFIAACTWPYWKDFEKWEQEAKGLLIEAARAQTHGDGVNCEQAVSYQQFVLDFLILSALAGRARDIEFPEQYWLYIEHMIEYIHAIMDVGFRWGRR